VIKALGLKPEEGGYFAESARPLTSLVFVLPVLLFYELGIWLLGSTAIHNAASIWLRQLLNWLGFGQYLLLPILVVAVLMSWHHLLHQKWKLEFYAFGGMLAESVLWACMLVLIWRIVSPLLTALPTPPPDNSMQDVAASLKRSLSLIVTYCGAGLYEELLFRLLMLPLVFAAFRVCHLSTTQAAITAVIFTSVLFSLAHYEISFGGGEKEISIWAGEAWNWGTFLFRLIAGIFFAVVFAYRGFGITVVAHVFYDVLTLFL
jgi:hypothetical protein